MIKYIIAVGIGSCIGGIGRYLLTQFVQNKFSTYYPYGTFVVNVVGCLLIGIAFGYAERSGAAVAWKLFVITGILGGFTTFSSFSNETITLLKTGHMTTALLYVFLSLALGLLATYAGVIVSRAV